MMLALAIFEAIMNKSFLTIIVAPAIAFFSVPSTAGDNYIYKIMTCFHGHPRHSDGCRSPTQADGTEASKNVHAPPMP